MGAMKRSRGLLLAAVLPLVAASIVLLSPAPPAQAAPVWQRYMDWNIHGYHAGGGGHAGDVGVAYSFIFDISSRISEGNSPVAITVQEICWDGSLQGMTTQYDALYNYLTAQGYQARFGKARTVTSNGNCDQFGDAVFAWGGAYSGTLAQQYKMYKADFTVNGLVPSEDRQMICVGAWAYTVVHHACSTHLDNAGQPYQTNVPAYFQVGAVFWMLRNAYQPGSQYVAAFLGGDLNQDYDRVSGNSVAPYSDYLEAETVASPGLPGSIAGATEPGGYKIDFAFVRSNNFYSSPRLLYLLDDSTLSDHYRLFAAFLNYG